MSPQDTNTMRQIFISYSSRDKKFELMKQRLIDFLEEHGFKPFISGRDIRASQYWDKKILEALKKSDWFIVVLSPQSVESEPVKDECNFAVHNKKRIIPLYVECCNVSDINLNLPRIQRINVKNGWNSDAEKQLLDSLNVDTSSASTINVKSSDTGNNNSQKLSDVKKKKLREEIATNLTEDKLRSIFEENEDKFGRNFYIQIPGSDYRTRIVNVIRELNNRELMNHFIRVVREEYSGFAEYLCF